MKKTIVMLSMLSISASSFAMQTTLKQLLFSNPQLFARTSLLNPQLFARTVSTFTITKIDQYKMPEAKTLSIQPLWGEKSSAKTVSKVTIHTPHYNLPALEKSITGAFWLCKESSVSYTNADGEKETIELSKSFFVCMHQNEIIVDLSN